ncbi:MAG: hypothetical protein ABL955_03705 [Elusimicrobiota bacterium]
MRFMNQHGWKIYLIALPLSFLIVMSNRGNKDKWSMRSDGKGFVLSLKGSSNEVRPASLEIRCGGDSPEVRLVMPVKVRRMGGGGGPLSLPFAEEYLDDKRKPLPGAGSAERWSYNWGVSGDFTYASLKDAEATAFLERIAGKPWVYLGATAMADNQLSGITIRFPVDGFGDYKKQVADGCPARP